VYAGCAISQVPGAQPAAPPPSGYARLDNAYRHLKNKDYDEAIRLFREALATGSDTAGVHKDLAYTYLKTGETEAARDEFHQAMRLDPADTSAALEFAFLCYETEQTAVARRLFDRIRKQGNATAAQAFENIDRPLREGIERWSKAVAASPGNFSAHLELARLAEQRDETALAVAEYEAARKLRPDLRELLLDVGRSWKEAGKTEQAYSALLAASRSQEGIVAEAARELLPTRYPYVYEFRAALALDPDNLELHRELAYLLLEMRQGAEAEKEFALLVERTPDDLLSVAQLGFLHLARRDAVGAMPLLQKVLEGKDEDLADRVRSALRMPQTLKRRSDTPRAKVSTEAKVLAERSLQAGYLKDAKKYLEIAHEIDPLDFQVMLKLGWTTNLLHDDRQALPWFHLAKKSPDPAIAVEAKRASSNLEGDQRIVRTTVWIFPFYSSRWNDVFSYGQVKTELRFPHWPVKPYISARFDGDTRQRLPGIEAGYLSESALIPAIGLATPAYHGVTVWGEAGHAFSYQKDRKGGPDYRGGVSLGRGFGHLLGNPKRGALFETNDDAVYLSRFDHDLLLYSQNRLGYSVRLGDVLSLQAHWNLNITADARRQYWANIVESGPGIRLGIQGLPRSMRFSVDLLRGAYLITVGNPWPLAFNDVRVGVWYAMSR
jgi:Tfp pilus assembly protein PilF